MLVLISKTLSEHTLLTFTIFYHFFNVLMPLLVSIGHYCVTTIPDEEGFS